MFIVAVRCLLIVVLITFTNCVEQKKCAKVNEYCQNHWDCCSNTCLSYLYRCSHTYMTENQKPTNNEYKEPSISATVVTLDDVLQMHFGNTHTGNNDKNNYNNNHSNNNNNNFNHINKNNNADISNKINNNNNVVDVRQQQIDRIAAAIAATPNIASRLDEIDAVIVLFNKNSQMTKTTTQPTDTITTAQTAFDNRDGITTIINRPIQEQDKNFQAQHQQHQIMKSEEPIIAVKVDSVTNNFEVDATTATTSFASSSSCKEIGIKCYSDVECCTKRCHGFLHQCVT